MSLQQIVPADLGLSGFCPVSQGALRVLPSSGFTRSVLQPFTNTTLAGSQKPLPLAANLTDCLFQSYDPAFDAIIGDNRTVYQVGPTRSVPWAVESPAYLPGTTLPNLVIRRSVPSRSGEPHFHAYDITVPSEGWHSERQLQSVSCTHASRQCVVCSTYPIAAVY